MNLEHFNDERIQAVLSGSPLTAQEREFLIEDTPHFEECLRTKDELIAMSDSNLMQTAYAVWADYARNMF